MKKFRFWKLKICLIFNLPVPFCFGHRYVWGNLRHALLKVCEFVIGEINGELAKHDFGSRIVPYPVSRQPSVVR